MIPISGDPSWTEMNSNQSTEATPFNQGKHDRMKRQTHRFDA
jgi:hypothetical protein